MDVSLVKQIPWAWAFAARQRENPAEGQGSTLTDPFDTPKFCRSSPAFLVNIRCISTIPAGVFGPPTGLESNTAEGSATCTDRKRLRRRAPTLTHVRQQAS